jgi:hypothetical protein
VLGPRAGSARDERGRGGPEGLPHRRRGFRAAGNGAAAEFPGGGTNKGGEGRGAQKRERAHKIFGRGF